MGKAATGPLTRIRRVYDRNRALVWACVLIAVNQLGFGSVIPILPLYAESFGVSKAAIGLTIAVYGFARFLMNVPTSYVADRYGRRQALALGGAITVAGNIVSAVAGVYWLFLVGRFVSGAGAAMVITGTQVITADVATPANRGRTMAIYQGTFAFAVGLGPLPGGLLGEHVSLAAPFWAYAILGTIVGVLAWTRVPETRGLRAGGAAHSTHAAAPRMGFVTQLRLLMGQTGFLLISVVSFCSFFARTGALFNLIPQLADNKLALSPGEIGAGISLMSAIGLVLAYPSGMLVDRFGRKIVIVPSTVLSGAALASFALANSYGFFIVACVLWALSVGVSSAAPAAYAADMAPPGMNAPALGMYRMLADFGYVVGPLLLGVLADVFSIEVALYGTSALVVASGALFALFAPETHRAVPGGRGRPPQPVAAPVSGGGSSSS
jgi:MFS family permease